MFGTMTSLQITCFTYCPKKGIIMTYKNIIDCFCHRRSWPDRRPDLFTRFGGKQRPSWSLCWKESAGWMAVSIGDGRYYKLFTGNSPPNRLLIEDINEPGLLSDEYVQGLCNTPSIKPTVDRIIQFLRFVISVTYRVDAIEVFSKRGVQLQLYLLVLRHYKFRLFTGPCIPVRSSRSSAMHYGLPSWMSVKTT